MHPIAPRLVELIQSIAPVYTAADVAPATAAELLGPGSSGGLVVWAGASGNTIFGAPAVNWQFRAWHDSVHIASGLGFTHAEEVELGRRQAARIAQLSGDRLAELVWLEVAGQALEHARTGSYISNQVAWTLAQLRKSGVVA